MNRPSHWILLFLPATIFVLWLVGGGRRGVPERSETRLAPPVETRSREVEPSLVLNGCVVDRFGWPVAGAEIEAIGGPPAATKSAPDGTFSLALPSDQHTMLFVRSARHASRTMPWRGVTELPLQPLTIRLDDSLPWVQAEVASLPAPVELRGEGFLEDDGGEPVANAVVCVLETGTHAITNAIGQYRLPLMVGRSTILARDSHGRVAHGELFHSGTGVVALPRLTLSAGFRVAGYVKSAKQDPCAQVTVELHGPIAKQGAGEHRQVRSDAAGAFAFVGVMGGDYELELLPYEGQLGSRQRIRVERHLDLDLTLQAEQPTSLRVVNEKGEGQADLHVLVESMTTRTSARTDALGRVVFRGVGSAPYSFAVRGPDLQPRELLRVEAGTLIVR